MDKLKELISLCKADVYIYINTHRGLYESVKEALDELRYCGVIIDPSIEQEIKTKNSFVEIQFYPNSPVSSYSVYHYDIEKAIEESLRILKEEHLKNH